MTTPRLAFHLETVEEYGIRRLVATVVRLTGEGIRNPSFTHYDPAAELADFQVTARLSPDAPHAWGWRHEYQPYSVGLERAQAMSRVLTRIERTLATLRDLLGPPDSFHTYLLHIARALDIRLFLLRSDRAHPHDGRFRQVDTLAVGDWIRHQERQFAGTSE